MSDKRFECDSQDVQFSMVVDGELILANPTYVVNLLNYFAEEREEWKTFAEQYSRECKVLQKENEQLKEENERLKVTNLRLQQRIEDLEKKRRPMRWSE